MSMKPILFNTEMVRAILEGRKSCTRRKIPADIVDYCDVEADGSLLSYENHYGDFIKPEELCQYYPGDVLYVRETWHKYLKRVGSGENCRLQEFYGYRASIANSEDAEEPWKPSIHMPKEAARLFLRVTNVRVERLQDITIENALKEGMDKYIRLNGELDENSIITSFIGIWNSTIKKSDLDFYGWDANPYVWVIEFERCDKPESEG